MTLNERIDRKLARLAAVEDLRSVTLSIDTEIGQFESQLTAVDAIGCSLLNFVLKTDRLADASSDRLQHVCDALSRRISYLLEPIATVESDAESCTIQMRSSPPQIAEGQTSYYELVVRRGGELCLCRYTKSKGQVRDAIPANVTREVVKRLAADFTAAVS